MKVKILLACIAVGVSLSMTAQPETGAATPVRSTAELKGLAAEIGDLRWREALTGEREDRVWLEELNYGLVKLGPGSFVQGDQSGSRSWEGESHRVTLSKPFWMGEFEVSQEQYRQVMRGNPSIFSTGQGEDWKRRPVEGVSWHEAMAFCRQLTIRFQNMIPEGYEFRLPTEAEWEYAAAGVNSSEDRGLAFVDQGSGRGTASVSSTSRNHKGVFGMYGNAMEWCYDWYGKYSGNDEVDPRGPDKGYCRVARGGSWLHGHELADPTYRNYFYPDTEACFIGFRVVLGPILEDLT